MDYSTRKLTKLGFTLIELLVTVAILAILIMIALSMVRTNRDKADDAKTKSELNRLKIAFEDYYADNNCYPPSSYFDESSDCGSSQLTPYLGAIPCNRQTNLPYILETDPTGCTWFKLYTNLKASESDPEAQALCAADGSNLGNYAISSDNVRPLVYCEATESSTPSSTPTPSPTPTPSFDPNSEHYYCSSLNNCTSFDPNVYICSPSYANNDNCDGGTTPCQTVGSCTLR